MGYVRDGLAVKLDRQSKTLPEKDICVCFIWE